MKPLILLLKLIISFKINQPPPISSSASKSSPSLKSQQLTENISKPAVETSNDSAQHAISSDNLMGTNYVDTEKMFRAEILWKLYSTVTHNNISNNKSVSSLFSEMFSDSQIAQKFECGTQN